MKNMKSKITLILLSLLLTTFFAGCFLTPSTNHAPNITSTEVTTAIVGEVYTYDVEATDPDGDTLTYTLTVNPPDMTIDSTTGVINWTPDTIGDYDVTVEVSDGKLLGTQYFEITVITSSDTTHTVTYNGNTNTGGAVPVDGSSPYAEGANVIVLGNTGTLVKTGFTFGGWNTAAGGSGTNYAAGNTFVMGITNVTLYAKWTAITTPTHTVTYNGNTNTGGAVPVDGSSPYAEGANVIVLGNTGSLVKTGFTFDGWNTAANGSGTYYAAGNTFVMGTTNVTLYAKWTCTNATLSDLTVNGTKVTGFNSAILGYSKELPCGTTTVPTVGATTTDSNASKAIAQATSVTGTEAQRTATVVVTAEDGTTQKTYTVTFSVALEVGDSYGGGIVAYIFVVEDTGYVSGEQHGLIAVAADVTSVMAWSNITSTSIGTTGTALGTGQANTTLIVNQIVDTIHCTSGAAYYCYNLTEGGYNDWYLPSKDELNKLFLNKDDIGGFVDNYYWSSSEYSATYAWRQYFGCGTSDDGTKDYDRWVRAVRAF